MSEAHFKRLLTVAACVLFALATLGGFHWLFSASEGTEDGLIAFGLLFLAGSSL